MMSARMLKRASLAVLCNQSFECRRSTILSNQPPSVCSVSSVDERRFSVANLWGLCLPCRTDISRCFRAAMGLSAEDATELQFECLCARSCHCGLHRSFFPELSRCFTQRPTQTHMSLSTTRSRPLCYWIRKQPRSVVDANARTAARRFEPHLLLRVLSTRRHTTDVSRPN